jgi:hypothetical protein
MFSKVLELRLGTERPRAVSCKEAESTQSLEDKQQGPSQICTVLMLLEEDGLMIESLPRDVGWQ